jgi:hypothetical protein
MKRMKLILPILLLLIVGCDEDATSPDDACVELTTSYSDAATELGTDMTMVNCEAQYAALGAWCDGDCEPSDTASEDAICSGMSDLDSASITAMCESLLADENDDDGGEETDCQALGETLIELIDADFGGAADGDTCDAMCDAAVAAAQALVDNSCDWPEGGDDDMPTGAALQEDVDGMAAGFCGPYGVCGGSGEDDDGDDDFPECFLDCDLSIFLSPTATCEFFGGDDISCTDDCTGDDAAIITLYPIMCGTCVEDGNCDDLFGDDGE